MVEIEKGCQCREIGFSTFWVVVVRVNIPVWIRLRKGLKPHALLLPHQHPYNATATEPHQSSYQSCL